MKVKGVNLGNWLVLEKWISPSLFDGTTAEDEYYLPTQLSKEVYEAKIKIHRSEYITERDFTRIKSMGMDAVRIPVPYFIFGDREPFIGCIEELDKAFNWAEKYGLQILIDYILHRTARTDLIMAESVVSANGHRIRTKLNLNSLFLKDLQKDTVQEKAYGESKF